MAARCVTTSRRRRRRRPTRRPSAPAPAAPAPGCPRPISTRELHRHVPLAGRPGRRFRVGAGSPAPRSGGHFSARWTGQIQPQFTETYTFYYGQRRRRAVVGERPGRRQQLDRPRPDGEQRHDRVDRRPALCDHDGVLRERRWRHRAPVVEQPVDAESGRAYRAPLPVGSGDADGHPRQLPAGLGGGARGVSVRWWPGLRRSRQRPELRVERRQYRQMRDRNSAL